VSQAVQRGGLFAKKNKVKLPARPFLRPSRHRDAGCVREVTDIIKIQWFVMGSVCLGDNLLDQDFFQE
jgi:hypothetical protein